jgi:hypothetical protein
MPGPDRMPGPAGDAMTGDPAIPDSHARGGEAGVLDAALRQFRDVLSADGYSLGWSIEGRNRLVVRITAGEGACAECLVPEPVMKAIMSKALSSTPYTIDRIELPAAS